jgi:anti-sigma factor RsiW
MKYDQPELGERLAAAYALGLMPARARRRFDRLLVRDATLAARVAGWTERLAPLDEMTASETPPTKVWRAIERRIGTTATPAPARRRRGGFFSWRGFAMAAIAVSAAIAIWIAHDPAPLQKLAGEIAEKVQLPRPAAPSAHNPADVGLSVMKLGVSERERPRWLRAALLLTANGTLSVTVEPPPAH